VTRLILGAGALVGDQLQRQERIQSQQQQQIEPNQAEIQRQRQQIQQIKTRAGILAFPVSLFLFPLCGCESCASRWKSLFLFFICRNPESRLCIFREPP
jgi:hypothetical protein